MDRQSRKRRLERFSRNERIFPGGDHPTGNCTACARIITDRFGGKVVGYYHADNPTDRGGNRIRGTDSCRPRGRIDIPGNTLAATGHVKLRKGQYALAQDVNRCVFVSIHF
jgi:hypothetical protein